MQLIVQKHRYRWLPLLALAVAAALLVLVARDSSAVHNEGLLEMDGDVKFGGGCGARATGTPIASPTPPACATPNPNGISTGARFDWADDNPNAISGEQGLCERGPDDPNTQVVEGYITETDPLPSVPLSVGSLDDVECSADFVQGATDDLSYHTGSDKDFQEITTTGTDDWACRTSANATSKADLLNAGFVLAQDSTGDQIVYFMAERDSETGDVFNGFWIFANAITVPGAGDPMNCSTAPTPKNFSGVHACGDVLIRFNYESGGRVSSAFANRWDDSALVAEPNGDAHTIGCDGVDGTVDDCSQTARTSAQSHNTPTGVLCIVASTGTDCRAAIQNDNFCGRVNGRLTCKRAGCDPLTLGPGEFTTPWEPNDGAPGSAVVKIPTFSEVGINLTAFGLELPCVSAFLAESRSSSSIDATLKDFVLAPTGSQCGAGLTTAVHTIVGGVHTTVTAVAAGTAVHDAATLTIAGPSGVTAGGSLSVERFNNISCTEPEAASTTVPVSQVPGTQTYDDLLPVTTSSGTSISYLVSYSGDPPLFDPATFGCEPLQVVDARISISPDDVNRVGESHTFDVLVECNDGSAGWAACDAAAVSVSLVGDADSVVDTCANGTGDAGDTEGVGECSVTFTSDTPGTVTGNASVTVSVGGVSLTRDTDPATGTTNGPGGSGPAVKRFVDARISINPDDVNRVGQNHTFDVLVECNDGGGWAACDAAVVNVTLVGDADSVVDTCLNGTGDAGDTEGVGECSVTFTSDTPGTVTGSACAPTVHLSTTQGEIDIANVCTGDANSPTGSAVKRFVDARISISPDDVNEVGQNHTFDVLVECNDGSGWTACDAAVVNVTLLGDADSVVDTCLNGTGDAGDSEGVGECSVTFTSDTPGTVTGSACAPTVHLTTTQGEIDIANVCTGDANSPTGSAVKRFVDAQIDLSPLEDTNPINDIHTILATVQQDDGLPSTDAAGDDADGFGPAPDGTTVCFSFSQNTIGATFTGTNVDDEGCDADSDPLNDCEISNGFGTCSIKITSATAGTVKVHATTTFDVSGVSLTRETDGLGNNSPDAIKHFEAAAIQILKLSTKKTLGVNRPVNQPGALFSVDGPDDLDDADFTVRDNNVGTPPGTVSDQDPAVGAVCISALEPGTYTVTEVEPPPGYALPPLAEQTDTATAAANTNCTSAPPSGDDSAVFIDPPLFDIQVNFKDGGSGETFLVDQNTDPEVEELITCTNVSTGTADTTPVSPWERSLTVTGIEFEPDTPADNTMTIVCTLIVDP